MFSWFYRSSGCYDTLRKCIQLPSARTLQDYTHYVEAKLGFSSDVDRMLINAAQISTCPAREKCAILLLDEMHIREQLIFDKHSGAMIGYTNISDIVTHLNDFESQVDASDDEGNEQSHKLAKTMMVFIVRGYLVVCSFRMHNLHVQMLLGKCYMIHFGRLFEGLKLVD